MELAGSVAVVTGGAKRLGRAIVLALAERGARVLVHYGRSADAAAETAAEARRRGGEGDPFHADLADEGAVRTVIPAARQRFGPVDILINSASIFERGSFANTTSEAWDRHFMVNLKAPFLLSQDFAAQVEPGRTGKIVNMGDWRGFRPGTDHFAYTITKVGLHGLTKATALALAPRIQVNELGLGAILEPPEGADMSKIIARVPAGRLGGEEPVVTALLFLLQEDFITGETLVVDGGRSLV
ncbi:MAG TPA: SDR family NAD(P)-dependent oxidoreductase [bacterium]|nr:SDR family NAD(P)-dependent oxidoreductase [bacterium]